MSEASDPRVLFERALAQTEAVIAAIEPDRLDDPTPCEEYDVRALVNHLVAALDRAARVGETGTPGDLVAAGGGDAGELLSRYTDARARATAAWADDARLDAMVEVPWGKMPGRAAVAGYTMEVVAHGWDLAKATGQRVEGDPELGTAMLDLAHQVLPLDARGEGVPFGPATLPPVDSGPYTQLAAWLGRRP